MHRAELATRLVEADNAEREKLIRENSALADVGLAYALRDICLDDWSAAPARATGSADALRILASLPNNRENREIQALALWIAGFAAAVAEGHLGRAVGLLNESAALLISLGKPETAASTQVIKLYALALLGRYDEAIECGLKAREVFIAHGDLLAAGKIEHNIGNVYFRRDQYEEAEKFQTSARRRFIALNDAAQLTKIENSLSLTLSLQLKIRAAEDLYQQALKRAEASGQLSTQAAIESSIGTLALYQGRYDMALDYLERSRRKYDGQRVPHLSALTEQEIADAYLELNLIPEAAEIYERVTRTFAELGMRAEEARARTYHARASIILGQKDKAHYLLGKGAELYAAEENKVGTAMVRLTEAQLSYAQGDFGQARKSASEAEPALAAAGAPRRLMFARWLHGEAARCEGRVEEAHELLRMALSAAESEQQPDIAARCLTSLGFLAAKAGDVATAERSFKKSVGLIEALRAPLPAEEFRTAFFADKLTPYTELVRLSLEGGKIPEALAFAEGARSRALADTLGGSKSPANARDEFEADLVRQTEALREELNYLYNQMNQPRGGHAISQTESASLQKALREREGKLLGITRQLQHRSGNLSRQAESFDLEETQRRLGPHTTLVEYTTVDEELLAFVVTEDGVNVVRNLGNEAAIAAEISQFRFQIDTLRHGSAAVRKHLPILTARCNKHLASLYDQLVRPLLRKIRGSRLVIVPHRALHYLPFQALYDGAGYLIEQREILYAPSAVVFGQCFDRPRRTLTSALLLGVADEQIPRVKDEIAAIGRVFPSANSLLNENASIEALRENSSSADVLHLACHGQFRSDNPLFSSLRLGNGWFTVRDACNLKLNCELVSLSACETGVNAVVPGDELIGLARGFFSAGAPSVLLSLWSVDDEATAQLMEKFYMTFRDNSSAAGALRAAQLELIKQKPHPFFWSPFVVVGR
jgi:CHAT domain-containing protein